MLRELSIRRADQVWCADITYIPMKRGSAYLCAVKRLSLRGDGLAHPLRAGLGGEQHDGHLALTARVGASQSAGEVRAGDL